MRSSTRSLPPGSMIFRVVALLIAMVVMAACTSGSTSDTTGDTQPASDDGTPTTQAGGDSEPSEGSDGETTGEPTEGAEIVWAFPTQEDGDFTTLDPNIGSVATYANSISTAVFDPLVFQDPETNEIVGGLAESWEVSDDGLAWTIKLKDGVTFHDGTPLTSEDVKFTFDRIFDENVELRSNLVRSLGGNIESVDIVDDLTVQINLGTPQANFLPSVLGRSYFSIVPKHAVEEMGNEAFAENLIGTGPYRFVEHVRGSHILLERNPDYAWGPEFTETAGSAPRVERLRFVYISEPTTRLAALLAGEVDVIDGVPPVDEERLANDPNYNMVEVLKNGSSASLEFNMRWGPTQDLAVREAIASAIDREAMNQAVLAGTGVPNRTFVEPRMLYRNEDAVAPDYDPDRARQILDEAGWVEGSDGIREKDGERLELIGLVYSDNSRVMEFIQAQLSEIGIAVQVTPAARSAADDLTEGGPPEGWHLFHGNPRGWTNEDPNILRTQFHTDLIPPEGTSNRSGISIPELDDLFDRGLAATDPDERQQIYYEAQEIVAENLPVMPMISVPVSFASRSNIQGVIPDARGTYRYFHDLQITE